MWWNGRVPALSTAAKAATERVGQPTEEADQRQQPSHDEEPERHVPQQLAVGPPGPVGAATQLRGRCGGDELMEIGAHSFQFAVDALPVRRLAVGDHEPSVALCCPRGKLPPRRPEGWSATRETSVCVRGSDRLKALVTSLAG